MKTSAIKNRLQFYKTKANERGTDWREYASAKHYLTRSPAKAGRMRGNNPWHDGKKRWIEDTDSIGLRFVCYADQELIYLRHKGYFASHYCDETYRGAVWQLPARNGSPVYVYGYEDLFNQGAAYVDFNHTDDKRDAAKWADSMAEKSAEDSREHYAKDAAEQDILSAREAIHENNREALALIKEIKSAGQFTPAICGALKSELRRLLDEREAQFRIIEARQNCFWSAVEGY